MSISDGPIPPPDGSSAGAASGGGDRDRDRVWRRELGELLGATRRETERNTDQVARLARRVTELIDDVSQLLPRVDGLDTAVAALGATVEPATGDADPAAAGAGAGAGAVAVTPATRWTRLSRPDKAAAWDELASWVAEVLNGEYRLSRAQLPDCWPVHPRAVRELAWLRTLHVATTTGPPPRPETVAEWHSRWLPATLANLTAAIDARECAPGRHRVTEGERDRYHDALDRVHTHGEAEPELTDQRGADRPRYLPARMPPRRSYDDRTRPPRRGSPRPLALDEATPPPPSTPDDWWDYFLDARMADLGTDPHP